MIHVMLYTKYTYLPGRKGHGGRWKYGTCLFYLLCVETAVSIKFHCYKYFVCKSKHLLSYVFSNKCQINAT